MTEVFGGLCTAKMCESTEQLFKAKNRVKPEKKVRKESMKKMKRFFAVLLAMAMVLGMSVTAFAEGEDPQPPVTSNPKIVINNVPKDATVTYEQIATAAPTVPLGWAPVKKNNVDLIPAATLQSWAKDKEYAADRGNDNAKDGAIAAKGEIATAIKNISLGQSATDWSATTSSAEVGTTTISNVTPGLYVIEVQKTGYTFSRMMAYVGYNDDMTVVATTEVTAKGEADQVKKEIVKVTAEGNNQDVDTSVAEGDSVAFKVTANYPYLDATLVNKKFVVTDTVAGGSIEANSIVVKVGDAVAQKKDAGHEANYDYELTPDSITKTFTVTFKYDPTKAGKVVEITYNVKVASGDSLQNKVESVISKYPEGEDPEGETKTEAETIIPKVNATVWKTDDNKTENARVGLNGAVFTLYVKAEQSEADHAVVNVTDGTGEIKEIGKLIDPEKTAATTVFLKTVKTGEGDTAQPVTAISQRVGEGNEAKDGIATFTKLDVQKEYWVAETQAPTGYSLNTTAKKLTGAALEKNPTVTTTTVDGVTKVTTTYIKDTDFTQINITDTKLNSLPSTGGIGTTIFTIGGCAIMIIAAGLFFATRRKSAK